jgi:hypothetical protein
MNATIARRKSGTRTRERIPMKKLRAGRTARLDYEPGALCQLNVEMSPVLKREIVERAERNENRLSDEVRMALASWCEYEEEIAV